MRDNLVSDFVVGLIALGLVGLLFGGLGLLVFFLL